MSKQFQRGLVAAAAALCGTGAFAQSSVTIYGVTAVEAVRASNVVSAGGTGSMVRLDNSQVTSSRLGFKGSEDLGGGLSAIFGLESGIGLDTGTANATRFWNRQSFVGLKGGFGTLTAGRVWNVNDDLMGRYFIFGGYAAFRFTEFGYISDLVDNAVKYVSPNLGGFTVRALAGLGEGVNGRTFEFGGEYAAGPVGVALTYRDAKNAADTASDKLTSAGVSYAFGPARVHAGYSSADPKASGLPKAKAWDVGIAYSATPALVATFDYVKRDQSGTPDDSAFWRIGADYYLSKRTSLMANIVSLDNKGAASQRFYGNGGAGLDQNVFSVGIRHTF